MSFLYFLISVDFLVSALRTVPLFKTRLINAKIHSNLKVLDVAVSFENLASLLWMYMTRILLKIM